MRWSRTLAATLIGAASACSLFGPDPDRLDEFFGVDASTPIPGPSARACTPARPPGKPDGGAEGADHEFAVVFSTMALLEPTDPRAYDLDGRCTCPEGPSCRGPDAGACDFDGGIDNRLLGALKVLPGADSIIGPGQLPQHFANGEPNIIVLVTAYDGSANDEDVEVYFIRSPGTPRTSGVPAQPTFDGHDLFDCDSDDAQRCEPGALVPTTQSPQPGYVHDNVLVIPDASFVLSIFADSAIRGHGVLSATIVGSEGSYALTNGIVAGALPIVDLVGALAQAMDPDSSDGGTFCDNSLALGFFQTQLCSNRDSTFASTGDGAATCDAVSAALSFEAKPFIPHALVKLPAAPPCPAAQNVQCD